MDSDTLATLNETTRREIRAEMGRQALTQRDLAIRLGWTRMYLSRRLTGPMALSLDDLEAIAGQLSVPVLQLVHPPVRV